jgi:hypothetical protein
MGAVLLSACGGVGGTNFYAISHNIIIDQKPNIHVPNPNKITGTPADT